MNALGSYLDLEGVGFAEFARRIGVKPPTVWRWAHGQQTPGIEDALAIEKATRGAVPVTSWRSTRRTGSVGRSSRRPSNRSSKRPH